jgi:hypothetical protein
LQKKEIDFFSLRNRSELIETVGERRSKQEDQVLDVCTAIEESE